MHQKRGRGGMKIEATTSIDYKTYHQFYLFNFMQGKRSPWQARIILVMAPFLFLVFMFMFAANPGDLISLAGMLVMLLLLLVIFWIIIIVPRRYYQSVQKTIEVPVHYRFTDENVEASQAEPVRYAMISRAYETRGFFYFYISRQQIYIIGKNDFTSGSAGDLSQFLKTKMGGRFQGGAGTGATGTGSAANGAPGAGETRAPGAGKNTGTGTQGAKTGEKL
jgi:hypothetical protein